MSRLLEVFIPTLNEELRLESCIASLRSQLMPSGCDMRIAIIDAGSTDCTRKLASRMGLQILDNSWLKDPEAAKMIGLRAAMGEFILFMDADMQCASEDTIGSLLRPLLADESIVASFGRYIPRSSDRAINRCLSMNSMQCDPVYQALVPGTPKVSGITRYTAIEIPPIAGTTLYRLRPLQETLPFVDRYFDVDVPVHLVNAGLTTFYFSRESVFFHGHVTSLRELVRKRLRNLDNGGGNGLITIQRTQRVYRWISAERFGLFRLLVRLLIAVTGVPLIPQAVGLLWKFRDPAALIWPALGPIVGLTLAYGLLRSAGGRRFLLESIHSSYTREQSTLR